MSGIVLCIPTRTHAAALSGALTRGRKRPGGQSTDDERLSA